MKQISSFYLAEIAFLMLYLKRSLGIAEHSIIPDLTWIQKFSVPMVKTILNESLLIVDDNANLRWLLRNTFKTSGYQLFEAENGKDALTIAIREKPFVILLDIMLNDELDGLEVCQLIKNSEELKKICVIVLSARGDPIDYEKAKAAGADFYINKPFSPMMLVELIETNRFLNPNR